MKAKRRIARADFWIPQDNEGELSFWTRHRTVPQSKAGDALFTISSKPCLLGGLIRFSSTRWPRPTWLLRTPNSVVQPSTVLRTKTAVHGLWRLPRHASLWTCKRTCGECGRKYPRKATASLRKRQRRPRRRHLAATPPALTQCHAGRLPPAHRLCL